MSEVKHDTITLVKLLSTDEGADIEFEPDRLGLTARTAHRAIVKYRLGATWCLRQPVGV